MDAAGLSWHIYAAPSTETPTGYGWAICPTFGECLNGAQRTNMVASDQILTDAADGNLPNLSLVMPTKANSQHNEDSMLAGDNWIGSVVSAIMSGPDWGSTAIFITYDDCGCFFDHVPPPGGLGIRVPMVIVSPFAKAGTTDSHVASFSSMLAFTEHVFGITALSKSDATAYDYFGSFDFTQRPLATIRLFSHRLPVWEVRWLKAHPTNDDDVT
jgi:phospholipase C